MEPPRVDSGATEIRDAIRVTGNLLRSITLNVFEHDDIEIFGHPIHLADVLLRAFTGEKHEPFPACVEPMPLGDGEGGQSRI